MPVTLTNRRLSIPNWRSAANTPAYGVRSSFADGAGGVKDLDIARAAATMQGTFRIISEGMMGARRVSSYDLMYAIAYIC